MDIKELIAQFDDMEAENGMNIQEEVNEEVTESTEEVNETKELAGEKVEYLFDVQVTMDAENEMSNAFIKTEIQRAIENRLEKYDVEVSVQNA